MITLSDLQETMEDLGKAAFDFAYMILKKHERPLGPDFKRKSEPCECEDCKAAQSVMELFL